MPRHALELLLRTPHSRRSAEVAHARESFCHAVGALRQKGVTLPQLILLIEAVAREVGASADAVLGVVGLCADDYASETGALGG